MCGIVGYIGHGRATEVLIEGLKKLEYRGYDSAGIAVSQEGQINVIKVSGRISNLEDALRQAGDTDATVGIGHTRWATHGAPTVANAHPHRGGNGEVVLVHNGIIENYLELKAQLQQKGYQFCSDTDTEVMAHLFADQYHGDPIAAMTAVMQIVRGSYAVAVMLRDQPDQIIAAKKDSPLIVGTTEGAQYLASDIPALLAHTRDCYFMEDGEIALIKREGVAFFGADCRAITKELHRITWDVAAAEKGGFPHFMRKEITEQPEALSNTLLPRIRDGRVALSELKLTDDEIRGIRKIWIVACGSAWHVGVAAKYMIEKLARIPCETDLASEFRYRDPIIGAEDLCIVISQSGETADTLAALREAKRKGARVLSIVNVVASTIARESDDVLYTMAGPEIAVATTKAFSAQLGAAHLIALRFARARGEMSEAQELDYCARLFEIPEQIKECFALDASLAELAKTCADSESVFFIGRGLDYAIALEGSLKLKEISYLHSEAYAAGELKHGTISLIEDGTLVFAIATQEELLEKMVSNIKEVKARGARVIALAAESEASRQGGIAEVADAVIYVPKTEGLLMPSLNVIPLQLFAYYMAVERGCDVDKPRNLAKSVTVE